MVPHTFLQFRRREEVVSQSSQYSRVIIHRFGEQAIASAIPSKVQHFKKKGWKKAIDRKGFDSLRLLF